LTIKYLKYVENVVKIGPVNLDIALLKGSFLKMKKEVNASKTYSPQGRHVVRATLAYQIKLSTDGK